MITRLRSAPVGLPVMSGDIRSNGYLGLRIKLDVNASCDWRCTMVTTSQEVSVSQLWRRAAAPVCFDLRKVGMSNFLQLNLILVQGHMATPHYMPINHQIQS